MKPRIRFNPYGLGYWTCRYTAYDGWCIQGVGLTIMSAYFDFRRQLFTWGRS